MTEESGYSKDLVVLVPGKNDEYALRGLFARPNTFGARTFSFEFFVHPDRDPGCLRTADDMLRAQAGRYQYALVLFDRQGCGSEKDRVGALEEKVEKKLTQSGWENRAAVVVLDPELEIWVWSRSPVVEKVLGWGGRSPSLWDWLSAAGYLRTEKRKPSQPKEAMEHAMQLTQKRRSSKVYEDIAKYLDFSHCQDPAFLRLRKILSRWFPV